MSRKNLRAKATVSAKATKVSTHSVVVADAVKPARTERLKINPLLEKMYGKSL